MNARRWNSVSLHETSSNLGMEDLIENNRDVVQVNLIDNLYTFHISRKLNIIQVQVQNY